jgi:glucokinase
MKEIRIEVNMILAGDIGGTKTLLGLYSRRHSRPEAITVQSFTTIDFPDLTQVIASFAANERVRGTRVQAAAFGVAGPVLGQTATLTNLAFQIDAGEISRAFEIPNVRLLNDLQAMAYSLTALADSEVHVLQAGEATSGGNMGLVAAGTGLGEAAVYRTPAGLFPAPTEAGHADWAARNERDIEVLRGLIERFGRAEVEHVLSGPGLVNLYRLTHRDRGCTAGVTENAPNAPAQISNAALERRCQSCLEALDIFVSAYGAEAGNLALRTVATGGLFVGGGIAPKILPALIDGRFIRAFLDKDPFTEMLSKVPVKIILNPDAGLLGAAIAAAQDIRSGPAKN